MTISRDTRARSIALLVLVLAAVLTASAVAAEPTGTDAAAIQQADEPDVSVEVDSLYGDRFWRGQQILLTGFEDGETVEFDHDDETRERTATDGTVAIDTSTYATGEWHVESSASDAAGTFVVNEQTLDGTVDDEHAVETTGLSIESNRASFDVAIESDDVSSETLAAAITAASADGDRVVLTVGGASTSPVVDVFELPGGEYELEVEALDSTASDTATITVSAGLEVEGNHPLPPEGTHLLYDVNGDRAVTNGDVVDFFGFQHYHPAVENHSEKFDFDGTGDVGQGDVVELFHIVNGKPIPDPDAEPDATFADTTNLAERSGVATIDVEVVGTDEAWINLSHSSPDGAATVHLQEIRRGKQTVTVAVDVQNLSRGAPVADVFDADGATLGPETGDTGDFADGSPDGLAAGDSVTLRSYGEDPENNRALDRARLLLERTAFQNDTYAVPTADVATVDMDVTGYSTVWVTVDHEAVDGTGIVALHGRDANTTLGIDTEALSRGESAEAVFGALDASVGDDSRLTGAFADGVDEQVAEGSSFTLRTYREPPDDADATDRARLTVGEPSEADPDARFALDDYTVLEDEVASLEVDLDDTHEGWVTVEHEGSDGAAVVHLENAFHDEEPVVLEVDLERLSARPAADVFDVEGATLGPQTAQTGDFSAWPADGWSADTSFQVRAFTDDPDESGASDRMRLTVAERPIGEVTSLVASGDVDPTSAENVSELLEQATPSSRAAPDDLVVVRVDDPLQTGYVGENASDFDPTGQDLRMVLNDRSGGTFGPSAPDTLEAFADDVTVLTSADEERFVIAFYADNVTEPGGDVTVTYGVGPENDHRVDDGTQVITASTGISVVTPDLTFDGEFDEYGRLLVQNDSRSEISVETDLAPGTEGEIFVESRDLAYLADIVVDENGTATGTFDFRSGEVGEILDAIDVTLFAPDGDRSVSIEGQFVAPEDPAFDVTASAPEATGDAQATLEATIVNDGRQTQDAEIAVTADGETLATFTVELEPGDRWSDSYQVEVDGEATNWTVETQTESVEGTIEPVEAA